LIQTCDPYWVQVCVFVGAEPRCGGATYPGTIGGDALPGVGFLDTMSTGSILASMVGCGSSAMSAGRNGGVDTLESAINGCG
jgi:hypothetical protein